MSPIFHATRLLNPPILGMSKGNAQFRTHIRHLDGDHQMQSSSENNHFLAIGRPLVSGSFQRTVCLVARNKLRRNSSPGGTNKKSWLVHSCSACLRCQYRNDHTANMAVCVPRFQTGSLCSARPVVGTAPLNMERDRWNSGKHVSYRSKSRVSLRRSDENLI